MVTGFAHVRPHAQVAVIRIQQALGIDGKAIGSEIGVELAAQLASEIIGDAGALGHERAGNAINTFGVDQIIGSRAHVIHFQDQLGTYFPLDTKEPVAHERVANSLRENDTGQPCQVGVGSIPPGDVTGGLHSETSILAGWRWAEKGRRSACRWTIDDLLCGAGEYQIVERLIQGIIRRVPACIRHRSINCSLVSHAKTAAQSGFAVAEEIISKSKPRTEVQVIAGTEGRCRSKAARPTNASQNGTGVSGAGSAGVLNLAGAGSNVVNYALPWPFHEGSGKVVGIGEPRIKVVAQTQVESEAPGKLPIILSVEAECPVAEVSDIGGEMGRATRLKSRINSCPLAVGRVESKKKRVKEGIGGPALIGFGMLQVAADIAAYFYQVLAATERYQVGIGVRVLAKILRVAGVRAKANGAVVEGYGRHTRQRYRDQVEIRGVAGTKLVYSARAENTDKAELEIRRGVR